MYCAFYRLVTDIQRDVVAWSELRGVLLGSGGRETQSVPVTRGATKEAAAATAAAAAAGTTTRTAGHH